MKYLAMGLAVALAAGCGHLSTRPAGDTERTGVVTLRGMPLTLLGEEPPLGAPAPDFRVVDAQYEPVRLADFRGRPVLISVVPSLDTPVCALQTRRFIDALATFPEEVVALTLSLDLPFAQKRFCEAAEAGRMRPLSDAVDREFGRRYGLLIRERGLLARAILIVGRDGTLRYRQVVPEMTSLPDFDQALEALRAASGP